MGTFKLGSGLVGFTVDTYEKGILQATADMTASKRKQVG
jgi:hypothetical protein